MASGLIHEKIWMDKSKYDDAERQHYENLAKLPKATKGCAKESDSNSNLSSPETPILNSKKTKIPKYVLVARETDYASILELCEFKEKTSKRSKKSKEANRQRELMMNSISNKELPPSPAREEPLPVIANVEAPIKPQKNKETKEKLSKAEKKRANRKEKEESHKIEEKQPVVESVSQIKDDSDPCDPGDRDPDQGGSTLAISSSSLASEVAKARQHIKNSLECMDTVLASVPNVEVSNKINYLETAISDLRNMVLSIQSEVKSLVERVDSISVQSAPPHIAVCPMPPKVAAPAKAADPKEDSDDGVDLFASDSDGEDDAAAAKIREERLASYAAKKSNKPVLIAKSNIILDVKPWDDETDMKVMEEKVRSIVTDGLLWGASKLVTLAYGIQKLQISCVVEDDKVSIDWLQEEIEKNEDYVQSVDIAAFNKV